MDSLLITLVVVAIAALSNWLQHRAQAREEAPPEPGPQPPRDRRPQPPVPAPPRSRQPVPPQTTAPRPEREPRRPETDWEEVVRRFLGGESPAPPPVQPRTPRPEPKPIAPPVQAPLPPIQPRPLVVVPPPTAAYSAPSTPVPAPPSTYDAAYSKAQHLHETVSKRLREVHAHPEHRVHRAPAPTGRRHTIPEISLIHRIRHDPAAARGAFVASLVFGPPKGLE